MIHNLPAQNLMFKGTPILYQDTNKKFEKLQRKLSTFGKVEDVDVKKTNGLTMVGFNIINSNGGGGMEVKVVVSNSKDTSKNAICVKSVIDDSNPNIKPEEYSIKRKYLSPNNKNIFDNTITTIMQRIGVEI